MNGGDKITPATSSCYRKYAVADDQPCREHEQRIDLGIEQDNVRHGSMTHMMEERISEII